MKKRAIALLAVLTVLLTLCAGCTKKTGAEKLDFESVVLKVGDHDITLREAYFIMKWRQAQYQTMASSLYGEDWYNQDVTGTGTFIEYIKGSVIDELETMYILADNADTYGVSLEDADKEAIETTVKAFMDANTEEAQNAMGATEDIVRKVMTNYRIYNLVYNAMLQDVDTSVTMEEAAQKTFEYVYQPLTETDEDGDTVDMPVEQQNTYRATFEAIKNAKTGDTSFEDAAKEYGFSVSSHSFGSQDDGDFADIDAQADALAVGEVSDPVPVEGGLFLLCKVSDYDEEATENARQTIADEKLAEAFDTAYEALKKDVDIDLDEDLWATANFDRTVEAYREEANQN